jgi:hypothetical protein
VIRIERNALEQGDKESRPGERNDGHLLNNERRRWNKVRTIETVFFNLALLAGSRIVVSLELALRRCWIQRFRFPLCRTYFIGFASSTRGRNSYLIPCRKMALMRLRIFTFVPLANALPLFFSR